MAEEIKNKKEANKKAASGNSPIFPEAETDQIVADVVAQRRASLLYFNQNFYQEWADTYQSMKARVTPVMVKLPNGTEEEDTTRTNICLPDHHVMVRRGTARLTRNRPSLRVTGGSDQGKRDAVSAMLAQYWDKSRAQVPFRSVVKCCKAMGWGIAKNYWNEVTVTRKFRRRTESLKQHEILSLRGAPDDEVDDAERSNAPVEQTDMAALMAEHGDQVVLPTEVVKYSGPTMDYVFVGDIFVEPGFHSINQSAYVDEYSLRDENWVKYWAEQTTTDPETDEEIPVLDPYWVKKLEEIPPEHFLDSKEMDLRRMMREQIDITDPRTGTTPPNIPIKRWAIDERHSVQNGLMRIDYVAHGSIPLGRQWYPFDTYGRYLYTELILIPDIIEGIGDSPARITKFLMQLRNTRKNQQTDFINNKLMPLIKMMTPEDLTDQDITRTAFGRLLKVRDMSTLQPFQDPPFPAECFQDQAELVREMQQVAPETADFTSGTPTVPNPGQLATTARLQQQAADSVLADELEQINIFIRDTTEIWLCMAQQVMDKPLKIDSKHMVHATSMTGIPGEQAREITIDPLDIQEEFEIMPEAGSTLSDDDDFKTNAIKQGFMLAAANPDVLNKRAFAQKLIATIPGISIEEGMAPPPGPPPPPPGPQIHINLGITAKYEDLPSDVQTAILQMGGLPTAGTEARSPVQAAQHAAKAIGAVRDAANAATELDEPAEPGRAGSPPNGNGQPRVPVGSAQGNGKGR